MVLKGGVLIIGSLLWDPNQNDKIGYREKWRKMRLSMNEKIHVKAPIRYERRSGEMKNLTMVFSKECSSKNKLGTAYLVPLKNGAIRSFKGIENQARFLSEAEGSKNNFLTKGNNNEWCTIGILFNPKMNKKTKDEILSKWRLLLVKDGGLKNINIYNSVLSENGEIKINWLEPVNNNERKLVDKFDFVLATCTRPTETPFPNTKTICKDAASDARKYFYNNIKNGITTYQDRGVIAEKSCT